MKAALLSEEVMKYWTPEESVMGPKTQHFCVSELRCVYLEVLPSMSMQSQSVFPARDRGRREQKKRRERKGDSGFISRVVVVVVVVVMAVM